MKVYHHIDEFQPVKNAVVTIGTFDGVHSGHRKIINRITELAREIEGETVILTFFPHPRMILHPEDQDLKLITTIKEKAELLEELGIDHLIITPFSRDFSNQDAEEYIREILVRRIGTRKIVIGYDHRFGKDRQGGLSELQQSSPKFGYDVIEIPEQDINDVAVSSTRIRAALSDGNIKLANTFLGYPFYLTGKVIKGDQIGRQLGYPTANLLIEEKYKLIPCDGIYASKIKIGTELFDGMSYIGHRPTINGMTRNIEVNIFNFNQDIYNQEIKLLFIDFVRHDIKFSGLDGLIVQLGKDKEAVSVILSKDQAAF